jgi:hypothetical protein
MATPEIPADQRRLGRGAGHTSAAKRRSYPKMLLSFDAITSCTSGFNGVASAIRASAALAPLPAAFISQDIHIFRVASMVTPVTDRDFPSRRSRAPYLKLTMLISRRRGHRLTLIKRDANAKEQT